MQINKLFGKLTPAHPYLLPVQKAIREKYNFPEIAPGDDTLAEILGSEDEIDLEALHQDIEAEIRKNPEFLPPETKSIFELLLLTNEESRLNFPGLEELSPEMKNNFIALLGFVALVFEPYRAAIDSIFSTLADNLLEYLLTGETRDLPEYWFQTAYTMNMVGEPIVVAMCNQAADPKEVAQLFKSEYTKAFGKDRPKITTGQLNNAEYLRMKLEGKPINYLVDIYAENHPSQFPNGYRAGDDKHYQLMKKRLQRLEKQLDKMLGTKTG